MKGMEGTATVVEGEDEGILGERGGEARGDARCEEKAEDEDRWGRGDSCQG